MVEVETLLRAAGERAVFPGEDRLADRVLARLEDGATNVGARRRAWRPVLLAAAAAVLAVALTIGLSPGVRRAVADLLGIGAVRVHPAGTASATTLAGRTVPEDAALGQAVESLADARATTGLALPVPEQFGPPDAVFVHGSAAGDVATLRWAPTAALPPTADPRAGALLTVVRAEVDSGLIDKVLHQTTRAEQVTVDGTPALLLSGGEHFIALRAADGTIVGETARLAGTTLLWTADGLTYRLEAELPPDDLIAIAESLT
jgi:hypothetical protein